MMAVSGHLLRHPVRLEDDHIACTTVVRNPYDWALSHYFHALRRAWIPSDASFEVYLTKYYGLGNYQTQHFAESGRAVDAIDALADFVLVGVTDQLQAYREHLAAFIQREMGHRMVVRERASNVAPNRTRNALELSTREQRVLLDVLGEDVKLYHYASQRARQLLLAYRCCSPDSTDGVQARAEWRH